MPPVDKTAEHFSRYSKRVVVVKTKDEAVRLLSSVKVAALDFETTSLSPTDGDIRITSVCNDDVCFVIDHFFIGHFSEYVDLIADPDKIWWVYNAKFETTWVDQYDETESFVAYDVDFAKKAKKGGAPSKLLWMAKDIGIQLDKTEQNSDWSRPVLTTGQYQYAGFDAYVTWELKKHWWDSGLNDDQRKGFHVFNDAVRATVECERTGLILDIPYHQRLVDLWAKKHRTFERYLRKWVPEDRIKNLRSNDQIGRFLTKELHPALLETWPRTEKTKKMQLEGDYLRAVARRMPYPMSRWMAALVGFKYYDKYLSTYGEKLIDCQKQLGKIRSRFNIAQAATGRYSSSSENLQNIPRKPVVRRSFSIARPTTAFEIPPNSPLVGGKLMTLADYSGIEVRVLAELSQDENLLQDSIYGDVHSASACQLFGHDPEWFAEVLAGKGKDKHANAYPMCKEHRSKAKGFTFQLTYGAGPGALSDVLHCTYDEAIDAIVKWAERYPKAYGYRDKMFDIMQNTGYLPVVDGRTIWVWPNDRSMPVAANYPIQGAAASVMYRAMYRVRERFIKHEVPAWLAATVHDELLCYAEADAAQTAMEQQIKGMEEGWLDIFPGTTVDNLIDFKVGTSWKDKP